MTDTESAASPPTAVSFDPEADPLPPELHDPSPERALPVLLIDASERPEWAADTAIRIASEWASAGRRVVLADLQLEEPILHQRAGEENLEGVTDIFLYGASLARSARPVREGGFFLISSGTYTSDPASIHRHPRWEKLTAGFQDANAVLLVFAPGSADLASLSRWASATIVLGDGDSAPARLPVRAVLVPPGPPPDAPDAAPPLGKGVAAPAPAETPVQKAELPGEPVPTQVSARRRRKQGKKRVSPALWILLVLALLAAAAFLAWERNPQWLGVASDAPDEENRSLPPAAQAARGEPVGAPASYAVQLASYSTLEGALEAAAGADERLDNAIFYVSPEIVDGVLYHKLLTGLVADTVEAEELLERLVAAEFDPPLVRAAPLGFDLGVFPSREEAFEHARFLLERDVPSYAVEVPYSGGSSGWHLYGGAYADESTAEGMRRLLEEAGLDPPLVRRRSPRQRDG
ncbi:MAG: hypothetical protein ACREKN_05960 [Longimicrobiaceae bacterium]